MLHKLSSIVLSLEIPEKKTGDGKIDILPQILGTSQRRLYICRLILGVLVNCFFRLLPRCWAENLLNKLKIRGGGWGVWGARLGPFEKWYYVLFLLFKSFVNFKVYESCVFSGLRRGGRLESQSFPVSCPTYHCN